MSERTLSISIAAYNVEEYLEKTLQSLVCDEDAMRKMEVLVIDDGSTDQTASVAQKYMETYPNTFFLIQKKNGGHGSTLNYAAKRAQGTYFRMLDGDDWFDTEELQQFMAVLEHADADIILSPYTEVYEAEGREERLDRHHLAANHRYGIDELQISWIDRVLAAEMTVKTEILQKPSFELTEHCVYTDSEYVFFSVLYARTYQYLPMPVYQYRIGRDEQTTSDAGRKKHWRDAGRVVDWMLQQYAEHDCKDMCAFHLAFLHKNMYATVFYQYANYFLAEDVTEMEKDFAWFNSVIQSKDEVFFEWIRQNCRDYQWLRSLFAAARRIGDRKCIVFGAGAYGKRALQIFCGKGVCVAACADNNAALWNQEILGVTVCDPKVIMQEYPEALVYVAIWKHPKTVCRQLMELGMDAANIICDKKEP